MEAYFSTTGGPRKTFLTPAYHPVTSTSIVINVTGKCLLVWRLDFDPYQQQNSGYRYRRQRPEQT
jgi:hypothetical protein